MAVQTSNNTQPRGGNRTWLWALIGLLLAGNIVTLWLLFNKNQAIEKQSTTIETTNNELSKAKIQLDSLSQELNVRIDEVKRLGGDVQALEEIKGQLEKDKARLLRDKRSDVALIAEYKEKVETYTMLLRKKDDEIRKLKGVNEELLSENTGLKQKQNVLSDSIVGIEKEKADLRQKVSIASALKAENLLINAISDKGKERDGGEYKARQLEKIKVIFNLAENKLARIEGKNIYMRLVEPDGTVLSDPNAGEGSFNFEGNETAYTARQDILFDNTRQQVSFVWGKGSAYKTGRHTVELYADGFLIGKGYFTIK
jgi:uncharacterized membrane-anchored protein YhcB (DUF1043 family)